MHRAGSRAISAGALNGTRAPSLAIGRNSSLFAARRPVLHTAQTCIRLSFASDSHFPQSWSRSFTSSSPATAAVNPSTPAPPPPESQPPVPPSDEPTASFSAHDISLHQPSLSRRSQRRAPRATTSYPPVDLPSWFLENYVVLRGEPWLYFAATRTEELPIPEHLTGYKDNDESILEQAKKAHEPGDESVVTEASSKPTTDARLEAAAADFQRAAAAIQSYQLQESGATSQKEGVIHDHIKLAEVAGAKVVEMANSLLALAAHKRVQQLCQKVRRFYEDNNKMKRLNIVDGLTNRTLIQHAQGHLAQRGIDLDSIGFKTAVAAELTAAASLASRNLPAGARRPVPVLTTASLPGAPLARAAVENAAIELEADVIHLDAHVLAEMIGKYLGQDPYMNKGPYAMLGLNVESLNGRLMPTPTGTPMLPFMEVDGDSGLDQLGGAESVVVGPEAIRTLRKIFHGDMDSKPDGNRWDDLKLGHVLEQILTAPEAKRASRSSSSTKEVPRQTIVHLHNFMELHKLKEGSLIVSKLRATVDRLLRDQGKRIVLVGSSSRSAARLGPADFGKMVTQVSSELDAHTFFLTPSIPEEVQRQVSAEDMMQTNLTNLALLMEAMLGQEVTFTLKSKESLHSGFVLDLEKTILNDNLLYRLATRLIAKQTPGTTKRVYDQAELNTELLAWQEHVREMAQKTFGSIDGFKGLRLSKGNMPGQMGGAGPRLSTLRGLLGGHSAEDGETNEEYDKYEQQLLTGLVRAEDIKTTWEDVVCPPETKESLQAMTSLVLTRPEAFSYGVLAKERIQGCLLYGPPGTGKTLMAKAIARQSGANVLEVSAASINDKYHGESEKRVRAVFSLAKKMSPAVIFLDEADALLGSRSDSRGKGGFRETLNQFLREWDGLTEMKTFVMVATNRPFDLDDAVLRRMPRRILVDLPLKEARLKILQSLLRDEHLDGSLDLQDIAARTEMCSGSDIKNICVAAAMEAVKEEIKARDTSPDPEAHVFPDHRTLTPDHFERALKQIGASISGDMDSLKAIRKFDERFGDAQGRGNQKGRNVMGFAVGAVPSRSGDARVRRSESA